MPDPTSSAHSAEILPPQEEGQKPDELILNQTLLAISHYTDRPDLLVAELEKHDPGFVRRMNAASEKDSERMRTARFSFGRFQAYTALGVSVAGAGVLLGAVVIAVLKGASFWVIIGLALFYAVTQGGSSGFLRLIDALSDLVSQVRGKRPDDTRPPADEDVPPSPPR